MHPYIKKEFLQVVDELRQLSFHFVEQNNTLKKHKNRIEALQHDMQELYALKTVYDTKSEQLNKDVSEFETKKDSIPF